MYVRVRQRSAIYVIALDRDTPNNLTRHYQTNGTPYCLGTQKQIPQINELKNWC